MSELFQRLRLLQTLQMHPITTTPDVRLPAPAQKIQKCAKQARLEVTEIKKICVAESVTR